MSIKLKDSELNDWLWAYHNARAEHAMMLRVQGLGYTAVGKRLGVGACHARSMAQKGERIKRSDAIKAARELNQQIEQT